MRITTFSPEEMGSFWGIKKQEKAKEHVFWRLKTDCSFL